MSVGAIVLLVAVLGITVFEIVSLIVTVIKKRKERRKVQSPPPDDNKNEEVNAQ